MTSHLFTYPGFEPDDGVGVDLGVDAAEHEPSFLCASGDLHWTVTVEPGEHEPEIVVLGVRWTIQ